MSYYPRNKPDTSIKANAQEAHAKRRARQRLGKNLNVRNVVNQIVKGKSKFIQKLSNNRTMHEVSIGGVRARVIYDKSRNTLVTVLPEDEPDPQRRTAPAT